jgi:hypothetical protein
MLGQVHEVALDRVVVDVIELLPHHDRILDPLGMTAFLPHLIPRLGLARTLEKREEIQRSPCPHALQMVDDTACRSGNAVCCPTVGPNRRARYDCARPTSGAFSCGGCPMPCDTAPRCHTCVRRSAPTAGPPHANRTCSSRHSQRRALDTEVAPQSGVTRPSFAHAPYPPRGDREQTRCPPYRAVAQKIERCARRGPAPPRPLQSTEPRASEDGGIRGQS